MSGTVRRFAERGVATDGGISVDTREMWRQAILRQAAKKAPGRDDDYLEAVAERLFMQAVEGDMQAIKEIGDRLDGKPQQKMELDPGAEIKKMIIRWMRPNEAIDVTPRDAGTGDGPDRDTVPAPGAVRTITQQT